MKIARVLRDAPDEDAQTPALALALDGALYDVAELEERFGTRFAPSRFEGADDFHTRVIALGGAGLDALDDRLRAGDRPTEARLLPGTFQWLPPCDPSRALHVQLGPSSADAKTPLYRLGNARGFVGHDEPLPFSPGEGPIAIEPGIAAILGEELSAATAAEAERAILGYAVIVEWIARADAALPFTARPARDLAVQLGPLFVSCGEVGAIDLLRAQVRVAGAVAQSGTARFLPFSLAESIAFVSRRIALRPGDVIGAGCIAVAPRDVPFGAPVELSIERLGKLCGRAVEGAEPPAWRAR